MKTGLFCTYENPQQDYTCAYRDQSELVALVESLGFDEVWLAEHHFNANAASPAVFPILAHLAARTSRIRLGTATLLLPFYDPIVIAENTATLDILSNGRFNLGVAKGGPFDSHYKHFHLRSEDARPKTDEALRLIQRLLHEERVTFDGTFFSADQVSIVPRPVQRPLPVFLGTSTEHMIETAARHDCGIMAGVVFPLSSVRESLQVYRRTAPALDPRLILLRFCHLADTREQAIAEASVLLQPFVERMKGTTARMQPEWTPWIVLERILAESLIGTVEEVRARIERLQQDLKPHTVALKPLSPILDKRKQDLKVFAESIWPKVS